MRVASAESLRQSSSECDRARLAYLGRRLFGPKRQHESDVGNDDSGRQSGRNTDNRQRSASRQHYWSCRAPRYVTRYVHGVRLKREITVAQENSSGGGITDTNDFTGFDMYRISSTGHRVKLNRQLIFIRIAVPFTSKKLVKLIYPLLDRLSFTRRRDNWGLQFRRGSFEIPGDGPFRF